MSCLMNNSVIDGLTDLFVDLLIDPLTTYMLVRRRVGADAAFGSVRLIWQKSRTF